MGKKNFLLLSLDDDKTRAIANTVSNVTCKKILDYLADSDGTESYISEKLNIPISTVHYNLKQLVDARLVEIESYTFSEKGKKIKHYTLANKFIIIAPKGADKQSFLEAVKNILPVFSFGLLGAYGVNMFSQNLELKSRLFIDNTQLQNVSGMMMESSVMIAKDTSSDVSKSILYNEIAPNSLIVSISLVDVISSFESWEWFLFGFTFAIFSIWLLHVIKKKFFNKK